MSRYTPDAWAGRKLRRRSLLCAPAASARTLVDRKRPCIEINHHEYWPMPPELHTWVRQEIGCAPVWELDPLEIALPDVTFVNPPFAEARDG